MSKISPFLWFDDNAEEAVNFYVSVFPDTKVLNVTRNPEGAPGPVGSVLVIEFELLGMPFLALNGGPIFKFNEAVSFMVYCDDQAEVDHYWNKLGAEGKEMDCGWITDKYGLVWQITPRALLNALSDPDKVKSARAMGDDDDEKDRHRCHPACIRRGLKRRDASSWDGWGLWDPRVRSEPRLTNLDRRLGRLSY